MRPSVPRVDWDQQVSAGFHYNATATSTAGAPGWTARTWRNASSGIVHMYHSARWGGWQYQLAARDDATHSLRFACTLLREDGSVGSTGACPVNGSHLGLVHGGWQEARGAEIGPQYTNQALNNSYFIENIFEELDAPSEWFYDEAARVDRRAPEPTPTGAAEGLGGIAGVARGGASSCWRLR